MQEATHRPRILLIEDNPADVYLVRQALLEHNFDCLLEVLQDGEEALRFIDRLDECAEMPCPHALLLDLSLPKWSGEQILTRLRRSPRCAGTPVVVLTSFDSPSARDRATSLGVTHYFRKPNNLDGFMKLGAIVKGLDSTHGSRPRELT